MASAGQPSLSKDAIRRYSNSCFEMERIAEYNRKLVIVGDGACGKTSLLSVFTLGYFPKVMFPLYTETDV
jgi:GTPase SAR1 family protein